MYVTPNHSVDIRFSYFGAEEKKDKRMRLVLYDPVLNSVT